MLEADGTRFVIEDQTVEPGQVFEVPVWLKGNPGVASFGLNIGYNPGYLELAGQEVSGEMGVTFGDASKAPPYAVSLGRMDDYRESDSVAAVISFRVKEGVVSGSTAVTVSLRKGGEPYNQADQQLEGVEYISGVITIGAGEEETVSIQEVRPVEDGVQVSAVCGDTEARVVCGIYSASGRMLGIAVCPVDGGEVYEFRFPGAAFGYAKAFIVDSNFRPLCESKRS